jgi:hypothetical protein
MLTGPKSIVPEKIRDEPLFGQRWQAQRDTAFGLTSGVPFLESCIRFRKRRRASLAGASQTLAGCCGYASQGATFSPRQMSLVGWRSRTRAARFPFTSASAGSERVL